MSLSPAAKRFFTADRFAVIGRVLTDRSRYDNKVLRWYQQRSLPVTAVRPNTDNSERIEGLTALSNPLDIPDLANTSISIIINPVVGLPILESLFSDPARSPHAVWLQPGAESEQIDNLVKTRGLQDRVIYGGPCVLVSGDKARESAKEIKAGL